MSIQTSLEIHSPKLSIELDVGETGLGKIRVNGEDWSDVVAGVTVRTMVGEVTHVTLECIPGSIKGKLLGATVTLNEPPMVEKREPCAYCGGTEHLTESPAGNRCYERMREEERRG